MGVASIWTLLEGDLRFWFWDATREPLRRGRVRRGFPLAWAPSGQCAEIELARKLAIVRDEVVIHRTELSSRTGR